MTPSKRPDEEVEFNSFTVDTEEDSEHDLQHEDETDHEDIEDEEEQGKRLLHVGEESSDIDDGELEEPFGVEEGELAVDIYQTQDDIVIQAAIAGIKSDALDVAIEDDLVTISGERRNPARDAEREYFHQECFWGPFSREIILPDDVDPGKAEASMKDGVFTLRMPRIKREASKKIDVKTS